MKTENDTILGRVFLFSTTRQGRKNGDFREQNTPRSVYNIKPVPAAGVSRIQVFLLS